jgi:Ca-activated chloride channel family protein
VSGGVYTKSYDALLSALKKQESKEHKTQTTVVRNMELFYYLVFLAVVTFLVSVTTLKRFIIAFLLLFGLNLNASVFDYFHEKSAKNAYEKENYKDAVKHYAKIEKNRAYFNLACGYYKNGDYEKALLNFMRVKSDDAEFKAVVFYNTANTLVRLKEFKKAKDAYLKSLTLSYTLEADENLLYIKDVDEQMSMQTGQQKTKNKSATAKQESSSAKKKEGGSSNMKVSANASSGAGDNAKQTKSESMLNLNSGNAKLSSKQYELINKRSVDEKKPW